MGRRRSRPQAIVDRATAAWMSRSARIARKLILAGHPTANIAERLGITVGTVKNHRRRIYEKLDITTERELFLQFFQHRMEA